MDEEARGPWDLRLLMATRALRAFGFGFAAVLLGIHLERRGLSPLLIGIVLTVGLLAAALTSLAAAGLSERLGRRRTLALTGVLMMLSGILLVVAAQPWQLILAGATGMLGAASSDVGPFLAIEQAALTETVSSSSRNRAFARYSLLGGFATMAGGLAAALGDQLGTTFFFGLYAVLGLLTALLPLLVSPAVERDRRAPTFAAWRPLMKLNAVLALDSFAGAFMAVTLVSYWLHVRFGADSSVLGPLFGALALLQSLSYEVAGRLADRIGLINTMVFTHAPAQLLVFAVPFAPSLGWAIALLLGIGCLSEMDVPARQAYLASIVRPAEREGAIALVGATRTFSQVLAPTIAGAAIQVAAYGVPFFATASLKLVFLGVLYAGWRGRPAEHEVAR
jgi:MFS family permease